MPPDLALLSTLTGSNYPCLELIFMVPKVFEPLKFDCMSSLVPHSLFPIYDVSKVYRAYPPLFECFQEKKKERKEKKRKKRKKKNIPTCLTTQLAVANNVM